MYMLYVVDQNHVPRPEHNERRERQNAHREYVCCIRTELVGGIEYMRKCESKNELTGEHLSACIRDMYTIQFTVDVVPVYV